MAPIAIFHSNRKPMYSVIAASTTTRPVSAFLEISLPHVGPTSVLVDVRRVDPGLLGERRRAALALLAVLGERRRRIETVLPFTICTSASV